jgi:predicted aldo/keto reductase-like oxidoreductase
MNNERRFTYEEIAEAIVRKAGFVTHAAESLGCSYQTVRRAIKDSPFVAEVLAVTKESLLDLAESELSKQIKEGNLDAVKFFLLHRGQSRDYRKEMKIEISDNLSELMEDADKRSQK